MTTIAPERSSAEQGTAGLTDMSDFETRLHDGDGGGGNFNDDHGGDSGNGDDGLPEYPPFENIPHYFAFMGFVGGIATGVASVEKWGRAGIRTDYVGQVSSKEAIQKADFSKKTEAIDVGLLIGPALVLAALGAVAGKKIQNFLNKRGI